MYGIIKKNKVYKLIYKTVFLISIFWISLFFISKENVFGAVEINSMEQNAIKGEWVKDNTGWWYRNADGTYPKNGWADIDGERYYFSKYGYRQTGWITDSGKKYFLNKEGKMCKNTWIEQTYYLKQDGTMAVSEWVENGKYYVDKDGKKVTINTNEEWELPII